MNTGISSTRLAAIHLAASMRHTMEKRRDFSTGKRRDICPSRDHIPLPSFAPCVDPSTDTSYLITGHKPPGAGHGRRVARALSPLATRFPLVNHGKPYIIGKQKERKRMGSVVVVALDSRRVMQAAPLRGCINRRERFVRDGSRRTTKEAADQWTVFSRRLRP